MTQRKVTYLIPFIILLVFSCHKKKLSSETEPETTSKPLENGVPAKFRSINGYLHAGHVIDSTNLPVKSNLFVFATFSDPATDLLSQFDHSQNYENVYLWGSGNVSVGDLQVNNLLLKPRTLSPVYYTWFGSYNPPSDSITWKSEGNGSFKSFDIKMKRAMPRLLLSPPTFSVNAADGFSINTSGYFSDYDSLSVLLTNDYISHRITKTSGSLNPEFVFSAQELYPFKQEPYNTRITIQAFNYSHCTIEDKLYIFELAKKTRKTILIN